MKRLTLILFLSILVFGLAGCQQKTDSQTQPAAEPGVDQESETEPIVADTSWAERCLTADSDFSLQNYELIKKSAFTLGPAHAYEKKLSALEQKFYAFAPDQKRYLDVYGQIDVYEYEGELRYESSTVEMGPNIPPDFSDPNYREPAIVNLADNTAQAIPDVSYAGVRESFWVSDQEFVLTGVRLTADGLIPFIQYFNLPQFVYQYYEGELERSCERHGNCPEDMMTLKVYITGCPGRVTTEYERQVPKTNEVARAALSELFHGPYAHETQPGQEYLFHQPNDIAIKEIKIIDNIAYVNLNDIRTLFTEAGPYAGMDNITKRNCEEFAFFEQTNKTLEQFSNIKDVIYFIEGQTDLFYDFIGIACPGDLCENNPFTSNMQQTYVYYNSCNEPVRKYLRLIPKSENKVEATLKEEFKGPYDYESYYGVGGLFARYAEIELLGLEIKDGIAYVNINDYTKGKYDLSHNCNKAQFFASVGAALTQFPEIKDAIYFIDGDQQKFYNWAKIKCPDEKACQYNPFK